MSYEMSSNILNFLKKKSGWDNKYNKYIKYRNGVPRDQKKIASEKIKDDYTLIIDIQHYKSTRCWVREKAV